jgi:hypothetical protein
MNEYETGGATAKELAALADAVEGFPRDGSATR